MKKNVVTVNLYEEQYWEVYDPQEGKIIAHFFDSDEAQRYVEWLRTCEAN